MIAASVPLQRPKGAKLMVIDERGRVRHAPRASFIDFLRPGDLVVANDAATLPASLQGVHVRSDKLIEVRLAGRCSPDGGSFNGLSFDVGDVTHFLAIVFGEGDFHVRTEERPAPPPLASGDRLVFGSLHPRGSGRRGSGDSGPLEAVIQTVLDHPRLVALRFEGSPDTIWEGIARHGRPIQYAHVAEPLALWDVWTSIAGAPVAFEPPSAGFVLSWQMLADMRARGVAFATLTHAAGLSSTGDAELDRRLPFDEPYYIPPSTAREIRRARAGGGRIVAVGTTVVRALEHAASVCGSVYAGGGIATQRIGPASELRVVDAILSGTHEPGTSHYEMLRAFADDGLLRRASDELTACGYRTHEFGDSVLIERRNRTP